MSQSRLRSRIQQWVRPEIGVLKPYHVTPANGLAKLDAMENPYSLPADAREAWLEYIRESELNRYPDPSAVKLKECIRSAFGIDDRYQLLVGNGSDEIIQIIQSAGAAQRAVLAPTPTFVMYEVVARYVGARFLEVPLDPDFQLDVAATLSAVREHQPAVIFLAYPNNPTGNLFDREGMIEIAKTSDGLVVIDEAYQSFAGDSLIDSMGEVPNILIMRTLSKLGLAGLRLGYAVAHPAWIDELEKVRLPYNVSTLSQASAEFALSRMGLFEGQAKVIRDERDRVASRLAGLGFHCFPSAANFILYRCGPRHSADAIFEGLKADGVLIKNLSHAHPALNQCLRVSVGTEDENNAFLRAMAAWAS